eukprot:CAMPEP_0196790972 /NCGR_PEP_ID=MMETSP1104-20130614/29129_2 /TAXON_ID=33652 /ORGANISM="Cafeteria sp., Strain Caron Lab Isolate" /LENGTH=144 /DNA_ID=CAMNT_0042161335 /DNA_START=140 /DNA_END=571 /DNA_ORIENTATION=-
MIHAKECALSNVTAIDVRSLALLHEMIRNPPIPSVSVAALCSTATSLERPRLTACSRLSTTLRSSSGGITGSSSNASVDGQQASGDGKDGCAVGATVGPASASVAGLTLPWPPAPALVAAGTAGSSSTSAASPVSAVPSAPSPS